MTVLAAAVNITRIPVETLGFLAFPIIRGPSALVVYIFGTRSLTSVSSSVLFFSTHARVAATDSRCVQR